jgi:hypothetical protein
MLHPLFENVLQTIDHFRLSCFGAPFLWLESPEIAWGKILIEFCVQLGKSGLVEPN